MKRLAFFLVAIGFASNALSVERRSAEEVCANKICDVPYEILYSRIDVLADKQVRFVGYYLPISEEVEMEGASDLSGVLFISKEQGDICNLASAIGVRKSKFFEDVPPGSFVTVQARVSRWRNRKLWAVADVIKEPSSQKFYIEEVHNCLSVPPAPSPEK